MKTHPAVHFMMAASVFFSMISDNWNAAVGWAVAWLFCVAHDYAIGRQAATFKALELFMQAHAGKWPSKQAEEEAVKELQQFLKGGK